MNILLFGCNGLLGQNIIASKPDDTNIIGSSLEDKPFYPGDYKYIPSDISDGANISSTISQCKPDLIINAAAMTNVDGCETQQPLCYALNRDAPIRMAATGCPMIHISTDYVFDGHTGPYDETDATQALGIYGKSKLESEAPVLQQNSNNLVLRTMLLWGWGHKLRPSFVDFVKNNLSAKKPVTIVTDQLGNPTIASDLALAIWTLLEKGCSGLYHVSGSEILSRFEWAVKAADYYGLDKSLIRPILTKDLHQAAKRPLNSGFTCDKLKSDTGMVLKNVAQQIAAVDNHST